MERVVESKSKDYYSFRGAVALSIVPHATVHFRIKSLELQYHRRMF